MSNQKRSHETVDPDYDDAGAQQTKRQRAVEQDAKEAVSRKIQNIVKSEFQKEINLKETELQNIDARLNEALLQMDKLRACVVATYYSELHTTGASQMSSIDAPPPSIHPAMKKHLGKAPKGLSARPDVVPKVNTSHSASHERLGADNSGPSMQANNDSARAAQLSAAVRATSGVGAGLAQQASVVFEERHARFKMKRKIIVGNVSKYIPVDNREANDMSSHKWMVYVRGPKSDPDISGFVKKVWFFLHHSYKPNDLVEVSSPPFHLTRRGWGEFPVRVQLHFVDPRNKKVDIIHHLKLDKTFTGLQTLGAETVVQVETENSDLPTPLAGQPSDVNTSTATTQCLPGDYNEPKQPPASRYPRSKVKTESMHDSTEQQSGFDEVEIPIKQEVEDCEYEADVTKKGSPGEYHVTIAHDGATNVKKEVEEEVDVDVCADVAADRKQRKNIFTTAEHERNSSQDKTGVESSEVVLGLQQEQLSTDIVTGAAPTKSACSTEELNVKSSTIPAMPRLSTCVTKSFSLLASSVAPTNKTSSTISLQSSPSSLLPTTTSVFSMQVSSSVATTAIILSQQPSCSNVNVSAVPVADNNRQSATLSHSQCHTTFSPLVNSYSSSSSVNNASLPSLSSSPSSQLTQAQTVKIQHPHQLTIIKDPSTNTRPAALPSASTSNNAATIIQKGNKSFRVVIPAPSPKLSLNHNSITSTTTASTLPLTAAVITKAVSQPNLQNNPNLHPGDRIALQQPQQPHQGAPSVSKMVIVKTPTAGNPRQQVMRVVNPSKLTVVKPSSQQANASPAHQRLPAPVTNRPIVSPASPAIRPLVVAPPTAAKPSTRQVSLLTGLVVGPKSNSSAASSSVTDNINKQLHLQVKQPLGYSILANNKTAVGASHPALTAAQPGTLQKPWIASSQTSSAGPHTVIKVHHSTNGVASPVVHQQLGSVSSFPPVTFGVGDQATSHAVTGGNNNYNILVGSSSNSEQYNFECLSSSNVEANSGTGLVEGHNTVVSRDALMHDSLDYYTLPPKTNSLSSNASIPQHPKVMLSFPGGAAVPLAPDLLTDSAALPQERMSAVGITKHKSIIAHQGSRRVVTPEERLKGQYEVLRQFKENPHLYKKKPKPKVVLAASDALEGEEDFIPRLIPSEYPTIQSLIKAAVLLHPLIQADVNKLSHPYCAESIEQWRLWPVGKKRACEWHRACFTLKYLKICLDGQQKFKGEMMMTTRQLVDWCRKYAYSPEFYVRPSSRMEVDELPEGESQQQPPQVCSVEMLRRLSVQSYTEASQLDLEIDHLCGRGGGVEEEIVDVVCDVPPTMKAECLKKEKYQCQHHAEFVPPSNGAQFVVDHLRKRGIRLQPQDVEVGVSVWSSAEMIYKAMVGFCQDVLRESLAVCDDPSTELTSSDVQRGLTLLPEASFCCNRYLGKSDDQDSKFAVFR